ncbi:transposase IS66 [Citreicella sp. 357]|nr:transposase IS66 [Citreicella sp. 357]
MDGYAGYNRLLKQGPDIRLAYCRAHARRKLVEIPRTGRAPVAKDGVQRIGELHRIEAGIRSLDPATRLAARLARSAPAIVDFEVWLTNHRARVARRSPLGEASTYMAKYWDSLCLFPTDGRIERDNDTVERTIRPIALNRKNALFAGDDAGVENWAVVASPIEICKLNAVDPQAWLTNTLAAIAGGHMRRNIADLMPWN